MVVMLLTLMQGIGLSTRGNQSSETTDATKSLGSSMIPVAPKLPGIFNTSLNYPFTASQYHDPL